VSVDLELESPNAKVPSDVASLMYVSLTRASELRNLLVHPIHPSVWEKIGKSELDTSRRETEKELMQNAQTFAKEMDFEKEFEAELEYRPNYSGNEDEWRAIVASKNPPSHGNSLLSPGDVSRSATVGDPPSNGEVFGWLQPSTSERHIGIDQGTKYFAMVAVDRSFGSLPKLVGAELYNLTELGLGAQFNETDLVLVLQNSTVLMSWMQQPGYTLPPSKRLPDVDRVVVHIEQISKRNKFSKQFGIELGRKLQQLAPDLNKTIVKLSSPHMHRANGPMFKLGSAIVQACTLTPASYASANRRCASKDVEPDSDSDDESLESDSTRYKSKKRMSSALFKYLMHADEAAQLDLQMNICEDVQIEWREKELKRTVTKFDDLGDASLHALDEILCGTSNYRQLVPSMPALHVNRTVVVSVLPYCSYYAVLQCTWNTFTLEALGVFQSGLTPMHKFNTCDTRRIILHSFEPTLMHALSKFGSSDTFTAVEYIRIVVKQLKAYSQHSLTRPAGGALTNSTVEVMCYICDETGRDEAGRTISSVCLTNSKREGWSYTRTMPEGNKLQVMRSSGKHTNAMLACLEWSKENIPRFVKDRPMHMSNAEKLLFFRALKDLSYQEPGCRHLQILLMSDPAAQLQLRSEHFTAQEQRMLADLVLIGLNKNAPYVSAIAPNYRQNTSVSHKKAPNVPVVNT
jgi:hypothetical protein